MFGSEILETMIGLIFVYLLLSVIVSSANELIESLLKKRAANLERGIRLLLDDPNKTGFAKKLFEHPLICCLYKYRYGLDGGVIPEALPSYVPAQSFALALMDIVRPAKPAQPSGAAGSLAASDAGQVGTAAQGVQPPANGQAPPAIESVAQFRDAVSQLPESKVKAALLALVDAAGNDAQRLRENIEAWFNSTMDRVTGWYRRWTQCVIFIVGVILTVFLNADTVAMFRYLSQHPEARSTLLAAAEDAARKPAPPPNAAGGTPPTGSAAESSPVDLETLKKQLQTINGFGLPLGWSQFTWATEKWETEEWLSRILGWMLTAIAISLGAPFWFNLLNKFIDIRSAPKTDDKPKKQGETAGAPR